MQELIEKISKVARRNLAQVPNHWLQSDSVVCDFARNGHVDARDFATLAIEWMSETDWH